MSTKILKVEIVITTSNSSSSSSSKQQLSEQLKASPVRTTMSTPDAFALSPNALARDGSDIEDGVSATRRLPTPPPKKNRNSLSPSPNNKVDLDQFNSQIDELREDSTIHNGCMGISLDTVLGTLKGDGSRGPLLTQGIDQRGFFPSVSAMVQKTLSPMNWSEGKRTPRAQTDDCTLEDDYDLMNRLPSWKTIDPRTPGRSSKQVQFQYPPITSIRLRPRTESDEIEQLYFGPDELDQIEDDRSDTKAADDIETLCVTATLSEDTDSLPGVTSTFSSPTEEQNSSTFSFINRKSRSPTKSPSTTSSGGIKKKRGIVRGVQILLREKSLGR